MKTCIVLIAAMLFSIAPLIVPAPPPSHPPPPPIGMQLLILHWPKSVCIFDSHCSSSVSLPQKFTIHGVWPADSNGNTIPCKGGQQFGSISPQLRQKLNQIWPSYIGPYDVFWRHEWQKHGRCSGTPFITYFQNAADNGTMYSPDIWDSLHTEGLIPSNTHKYDLQRFNKTINEHLKVQPLIRCKNKQKDYYIFEIGLCLSANFEKLIDCPSLMVFKYCAGQTMVFFPST